MKHICVHKFKDGKMVVETPILTVKQLGDAYAKLTKSLNERNRKYEG